MAKFYTSLTEELRDFIARQHIFFIATAPRAGRGNLSPKGMDTFRVLNDNRVAYLDLTGSGNETAAHLLDDGRITLMFCSFAENPLILKLYGRGRAVGPSRPEWAELHRHFTPQPGQRQIVVVEVESLQTSCGYGVPLYEFRGERATLAQWAEKKGEAGLQDYRREKNRFSIDGLPTGLDANSYWRHGE